MKARKIQLLLPESKHICTFWPHDTADLGLGSAGALIITEAFNT